MSTDKELEQYAHDCIRLAGMTDDPSIREPLLKMARDWIEVARAEQQSASSLADEHRREPITHRARH